MKNLYLIFSFLAIFYACGDKVASPDGYNLEGFELTDIVGSEMKRAQKRDEKEKLLVDGTMKNGKRHGTWVEYHEGKQIPKNINNYIDGVANGPHFEFGNYGQLELSSSYANNELDGHFAKYNSGRMTEEGNYKNGKLDGVFKKYYKGTEKVQQELTYKQDKLDGTVIYYNENGEATMKFMYKDGAKIGGEEVVNGK